MQDTDIFGIKSSTISVGIGQRQGCPLSPFMSVIFIDRKFRTGYWYSYDVWYCRYSYDIHDLFLLYDVHIIFMVRISRKSISWETFGWDHCCLWMTMILLVSLWSVMCTAAVCGSVTQSESWIWAYGCLSGKSRSFSIGVRGEHLADEEKKKKKISLDVIHSEQAFKHQ